MWWYVQTFFGWVFVVAAFFAIGFRVTKLSLGKDASRFVGTAVAAYAYYYVAQTYWHGASVWVQVLVPGHWLFPGVSMP